jgi:DNA adenine methylase
MLQKPFMKWLGGKTQIIETVMDHFPKEMDNYHEPFLGGGSVLLALLSYQKDKRIFIKNKIYAYDLNEDLIHLYLNIQKNPSELFLYLIHYFKEYESLDIEVDVINRNPKSIIEAKSSKESYYYWIRNVFNQMEHKTIEKSALFLFLNKTCFRGMFREGPTGFNVSYGHYKKKHAIITENELFVISDLIKEVTFIHSDFNNSMNNVLKDDFVYLDPPYAPESKTSFVGYTPKGFNLDTHNLLFNYLKNFENKKIKFCMSNANVDLVQNIFSESNGYKLTTLTTKRRINSKKPNQTTTELLIVNF